jgi:hypothetical protein
LATNVWIGSGTVGCQFLNQQLHSFSLSISESAEAQLAADFWISSDAVFYCWFLNLQQQCKI